MLQGDLHLPQLTVYETVSFAAALRMDGECSSEVIGMFSIYLYMYLVNFKKNVFFYSHYSMSITTMNIPQSNLL